VRAPGEIDSTGSRPPTPYPNINSSFGRLELAGRARGTALIGGRA